MHPTHRLLASLGLLAALASTASAKIDRVVEKSFQVAPGALVSVSTDGGDIRVVSSPENVVRVIAKEHIRARSQAEADEVLAKLDLTMEQHGNEVVASASYNYGSIFRFGSTPVEVEFLVTVPASSSVRLKTSGGGILVGDLDGRVDAHTSGGDLEIGRVGGDVNASTSGGGIAIEEGRGRTKLSTSGGDIKAGLLAGDAMLDTSGGGIRVETERGSLSAHTSGGDVNVRFEGAVRSPCTLSTSGGEVTATFDRSAAFHLDAETSGGDVKADGVTITIEHGKLGSGALAGSVNGGGPDVKLRSSGGDVTVALR